MSVTYFAQIVTPTIGNGISTPSGGGWFTAQGGESLQLSFAPGLGLATTEPPVTIQVLRCLGGFGGPPTVIATIATSVMAWTEQTAFAVPFVGGAMTYVLGPGDVLQYVTSIGGTIALPVATTAWWQFWAAKPVYTAFLGVLTGKSPPP